MVLSMLTKCIHMLSVAILDRDSVALAMFL